MANEQDYIPFQLCERLPDGPALLLAPHADDEILGCTASILHLVHRKSALKVVVVTDGAAGVQHVSESARLDYVLTREQESKAAAAKLGADPPEFWRYLDRRIDQKAFAERLQKTIQSSDYKLIIAPSPWEIHPDHDVVAQTALSVAKNIGPDIDLLFYEIGMPLIPNLLLDLSNDIQRKRDAIACFKSQLLQADYATHAIGLNQYRAYTLGKQCTAAEAYRLVLGKDLESIQAVYGRSKLTDQLGGCDRAD